MRGYGDEPALYWRGRSVSYAELFDRVELWKSKLAADAVGRTYGFVGDYSPETCAFLFALIENNSVVAHFSAAAEGEMTRLADMAGVNVFYRFDAEDQWTVEYRDGVQDHQLIADFRKSGQAGMVFFTSGSTGVPKGILHDSDRVFQKFLSPRKPWRTALFLLMDHFGGINTLIGALASGGTGVCIPVRSPEAVCRVVEEASVTLLPASPTFLKMMLASDALAKFDLSSVELITYGTEVMPEPVLKRLEDAIPGVATKQTYGLSELGVLRSQSAGDGSTWLKVGGDGFETKIVDGVLWVRSRSSMVGYLNAPSPFDEDGWYCTGDNVEVRGDYLRFLGRHEDVINVGGQKVYPNEIEAVLLEDSNVCEATVYPAEHPIFGYVPFARVTLEKSEISEDLSSRLRRHCLERVARHKVPMRFEVVEQSVHQGARFKKSRIA